MLGQPPQRPLMCVLTSSPFSKATGKQITMRYGVVFIALISLIPSLSIAQTGSKYAPITLDEATYNTLMTYLGDQPNKFSGPLVNWLQQAEAKAAADAVKVEPTKPADAPKP